MNPPTAINILIIGSGGREHAFAWKMKQSPLCEKLFVSPGNAGTGQIAENVSLDLDNLAEIRSFILANEIGLVVVGPEDPLVKGLRNQFRSDPDLKNIPFIGPDSHGAMLEGSKDFSKEFMLKYNIPTAAYKTFTSETLESGLEYLKKHKLPIVLKADGLAAGKGVLICEDRETALIGMKDMLVGNKFGAAGNRVVVEEFLKGIELSVFILCDGNGYVVLPEAKDYKRIGEKDTGLNTGGMGAVSPVAFADKAFMDKVKQQVIEPTVQGLKSENIVYKGFVFIGLMNVGGEPYVIEYNCRMGDPETEAVLPRIKNDLVELFLAVDKGEVAKIEMEIDKRTAVTVVMVSGGYPGTYETGKVIIGLDDCPTQTLFHSGTIKTEHRVLTAGGRVLALTEMGNTIDEAKRKAYQSLAKLNFEGKYFRKDIGNDLIA